MLENKFKAQLVRELKEKFPGCIISYTDPNDIQGFPDLLILYKHHWAALEGKKSLKEPYRPNQKYYIDKLNEMSFASMICPENKQEVLDELQQAFEIRGAPCLS